MPGNSVADSGNSVKRRREACRQLPDGQNCKVGDGRATERGRLRQLLSGLGSSEMLRSASRRDAGNSNAKA
jgi:hypothetical protein